MINRILFLAIFIFIGIPLTFLSIFYSLNYSGFCFAKMRYLSDEEKLRIAFDYNNREDELPVYVGQKVKYYEHIKYASFDEYIKENPDCCSIIHGETYKIAQSLFIEKPLFLDRITGRGFRNLIVINFKVRYLDDNGNQKVQEVRFGNTLRNCGRPLSIPFYKDS
ncbi:hypothetical protein [Dendronalium sp. ChiSLP03b]|uniref:hypothetical protein n=1 Tax=Dendronalium sp. ChiSLP03b TaxID=3075381 RepID=UPI002AD5A521|nr:hypothetical protein [Dendronalium sp. ChiSLP03b]MDZ8206266.1 hypothetical protein [Dendronalium sp. ChiSLP03b]